MARRWHRPAASSPWPEPAAPLHRKARGGQETDHPRAWEVLFVHAFSSFSPAGSREQVEASAWLVSWSGSLVPPCGTSITVSLYLVLALPQQTALSWIGRADRLM